MTDYTTRMKKAIWLLVLSVTGWAGSLDGPWQFRLDSETAWRTATVPMPIQAQFADLRDFTGVAWYRRNVTAPRFNRKNETVLLRFGAVDYTAEVRINGQEAGRHEGGYLPFTLDIGGLLRDGDNEILVRIEDPGSLPEVPHGKQSWYVQVSGIWQSVTWEVRPRQRIEAFHILADRHGSFRVLARTPGKAKLEIYDPAGKRVHRGGLAGRLKQFQLWSLDSPVLYTARLRAGRDQVETRFGFREFEKRAGKFYLNGAPIYLRGALDQDFYTEGIYTPPSKEFLVEQVRKAKRLGLNLLRCHIKVPDPRYLDAADEAGILIWYEIPNSDRLTEVSKQRAESTLAGMLERDANHPSLVIVSLFNESWGINLREADQRDWLAGFMTRARKLAAPRLVVDNSPCCSNFHVDTDIADFHAYHAIPDAAAKAEAWIRDYASRPAWLYGGGYKLQPDAPLVLSEFGNWGLPQLADPLPWWWSRGFTTSRDRAYTVPAGVEERMNSAGVGAAFPDYVSLARATQWHQWLSLKHQIERIRAEAAIEGYVITEFTDLNWEANGLLDMDRREKAWASRATQIQADDVIVPLVASHSAFGGETVSVEIRYSRYAAGAIAPSVEWELGAQRGSLPIPAMNAGEVSTLGTVRLNLPQAATPERHVLRLRAGTVENSLELFAFPGVRGGQLPQISTVFDAALKQRVESGERVLLAVESLDALKELPSVKVAARKGSPRDGNWITSFNWYRPDSPLFSQLPGGEAPGLLGWVSQAVTPELVLLPDAGVGQTHAGIFVGWVYLPAAYLVEVPLGRGTVTLTTFRLAANYGRDPFATYLMDRLLNRN